MPKTQYSIAVARQKVGQKRDKINLIKNVTNLLFSEAQNSLGGLTICISTKPAAYVSNDTVRFYWDINYW